jgi:hypothetical protein
MAADCCRADRAPQAETAAVAPAAMSKKELKKAAQPVTAHLADETLALSPSHGSRLFGACQADARAPSTPLFLTHAALLI